jgi:hypothetical protein
MSTPHRNPDALRGCSIPLYSSLFPCHFQRPLQSGIEANTEEPPPTQLPLGIKTEREPLKNPLKSYQNIEKSPEFQTVLCLIQPCFNKITKVHNHGKKIILNTYRPVCYARLLVFVCASDNGRLGMEGKNTVRERHFYREILTQN